MVLESAILPCRACPLPHSEWVEPGVWVTAFRLDMAYWQWSIYILWPQIVGEECVMVTGRPSQGPHSGWSSPARWWPGAPRPCHNPGRTPAPEACWLHPPSPTWGNTYFLSHVKQIITPVLEIKICFICTTELWMREFQHQLELMACFLQQKQMYPPKMFVWETTVESESHRSWLLFLKCSAAYLSWFLTTPH